jgi:hypothetical protein
MLLLPMQSRAGMVAFDRRDAQSLASRLSVFTCPEQRVETRSERSAPGRVLAVSSVKRSQYSKKPVFEEVRYEPSVEASAREERREPNTTDSVNATFDSHLSHLMCQSSPHETFRHGAHLSRALQSCNPQIVCFCMCVLECAFVCDTMRRVRRRRSDQLGAVTLR